MVPDHEPAMSKESLMRELRQEFMPRESLKITFDHILDKLAVMDRNLKELPIEIAKQIEVYQARVKHMERELAVLQSLRSAERLHNLEASMEEQKSFRWKLTGGLIALQGLWAFIEPLLKR